MTGTEQPIGDDDLQAYIDGRLAGDRLAVVEAYLAAHPTVAADVEQDQAFARELRARLAARASEPIPARLRIGHILAARRRRTSERLRLIAASVLLIGIGGVAGWVGKDLASRPTSNAEAVATRDAIAAYRTYVVEKLHPVEVRADEEAHLAQWLSKRLGRPIKPPDLTAEGYHLIGGRLLPTHEDGPAALFMYGDDTGRRLTLYARAETAGTGAQLKSAREADVAALSWADQSLAYVLTAPVGVADLPDTAKAISRQLRPGSQGGI